MASGKKTASAKCNTAVYIFIQVAPVFLWMIIPAMISTHAAVKRMIASHWGILWM